MLALPGQSRIFLYQDAMDLRKGFEGLSCLVEQVFSGELLSGAYFVFINKSRNRMKVLYWDSDGLVLWYKRLEKGRFPKRASDQMQIDRRAFLMLLEGIIPKRLSKRYKSQKMY